MVSTYHYIYMDKEKCLTELLVIVKETSSALNIHVMPCFKTLSTTRECHEGLYIWMET